MGRRIHTRGNAFIFMHGNIIFMHENDMFIYLHAWNIQATIYSCMTRFVQAGRQFYDSFHQQKYISPKSDLKKNSHSVRLYHKVYDVQYLLNFNGRLVWPYLILWLTGVHILILTTCNACYHISRYHTVNKITITQYGVQDMVTISIEECKILFSIYWEVLNAKYGFPDLGPW